MGVSLFKLGLLLSLASGAFAQDNRPVAPESGGGLAAGSKQRFCPEAYAAVTPNSNFQLFEPYTWHAPPLRANAGRIGVQPLPRDIREELPLPPGFQYSSLFTWEEGISASYPIHGTQLMIYKDRAPVGLIKTTYDLSRQRLKILETEVVPTERDQRLSYFLLSAITRLHADRVSQIDFTAAGTNLKVFQAGLSAGMNIEQAIAETPLGKHLLKEGYALQYYSLSKTTRKLRPDLPSHRTERDDPPAPYYTQFWFTKKKSAE